MKNILFSLFLLCTSFVATANAAYFLPEDFSVYTDGEIVVNRQYYSWEGTPALDKKILPTHNIYQGSDGGYVAIYTRDKNMGIYGVGGGIYVMGQIRVQGKYVGRIFIPTGYKPGDDITQDSVILSQCEVFYPEMAGKMWVGGDTGGWFGL